MNIITVNRKITEHFEYDDFMCPCCNRVKLIPLFWEHAEKLERLREKVGFAVIINSGYRCEKHNASLPNSAPDSMHLKIATDIRPAWGEDDENEFLRKLKVLREEAPGVGFRGIGTYATFTHVDCRPNPARWNA